MSMIRAIPLSRIHRIRGNHYRMQTNNGKWNISNTFFAGLSLPFENDISIVGSR